jgi:type IV pilus assembly protein PilX
MKYYNRPINQNGAALIVSLIILIAMTLIAVTPMKGTATELAMAGNLRESSLAFQAAEVGLRYAESQVAISTSNNSIADQVGELTAEPDYLNSASWGGASAKDAAVDLSSVGIPVGQEPKYIIKFVGVNDSASRLGSLNAGGGYDAPPDGPQISIYRITARARGRAGQTFRTVQSHYGTRY